MRFWDNDYKTWMDLWEKSIDKLPSDVSITVAQNTAPIRLHNGHSISVDGDITSIAERVYKELYEPLRGKQITLH